MNFYIGNLGLNVTENDLKNQFSKFGEVTSVKIIKDRFSGMSKGYGFLEMPNNADADKATKALNGTDLKGRFMKISQQDERSKKRRKRKFRF